MTGRAKGAGAEPPSFSALDKETACKAFKTKDPRFDGQIFVGVSSTGIYCRPVCPYKPKLENCTFFATAAEAERAGYRPCLVCRPEIAPGMAPVDAKASLARRAAKLLHERCTENISMSRLAAKLGYTDRHLRRAFMEEYRVTPLEYLQTCRLHLAKQLLTDSDLSIPRVAKAAGFGSTRRFNDVFKERYRLTPTSLRKRRGKGTAAHGTFTVRLGYRPPYRFGLLLNFFRVRALLGAEAVGDDTYARTVRVRTDKGVEVAGWIAVEDDPAKNALVVTLSESLLPVTSQVCARVRRQFDLDCDPAAVGDGIRTLDAAMPGSYVPGTRVPGCFDGFETCARAVLGQQVTLAAANKLAARIVDAYGASVEAPVEGLARAFPTASDVLALPSAEEALGTLGVIKSRSRAIVEIARLVDAGELTFDGSLPIADQLETLLAVKGIGPWSANYIAMRTMGYTDAFLETDAGIKHALPELSPAERLKLAEQWRPWRSYANISLWNALAK
ncbi:MAG: AlkA N-terminal domain-containing protein [Eggerthellaceae bacterium]|nr:AlkA N-terminal domain-containing protein [Eggerthellaceae bacterium]